MNIAYPVATVIDALRERVPALKLIGASADLTAALTTPPKVTPAAYVLQTTQGRKPQLCGEGDFVQNADAVIQVVPWVRNYAAAATGASARRDMDQLLDAIGQGLIAFAPNNLFTPLWLGQVSDEHYDAGWLTSQITFFSDFRIQK